MTRPWIVVVLVLSLSPVSFACKRYVPPPTRVDQGCINQGNDRRIGAPVVCWMQRHLSWRSDKQPAFKRIGPASRTNLGLAWPPYLVLNSQEKDGTWRMFRLGIRYDRSWKGYIFPTAAWKCIDKPLTY